MLAQVVLYVRVCKCRAHFGLQWPACETGTCHRLAMCFGTSIHWLSSVFQSLVVRSLLLVKSDYI